MCCCSVSCSDTPDAAAAESSLPRGGGVYPGTAGVNLKEKGWHSGVFLCSVTSEGKRQMFISSLEGCEADT